MNFIILGKNLITFGTFFKRFLKEKIDFESPILVLFATSTVHTTYINSQNTTFSFKYVDFCPQIFLILYPSLLLIQNQEEFLTRGINFIASEARFLQEAY